MDDLRIENVKVYGMEETARASGYPMKVDLDAPEEPGKRERRLRRLGRARPGSGHDCALKGIVVQADVTAPQYWWLQFGRYHFADIVSSQSKMHRLTEMDIDKQCNQHVPELFKGFLREAIKAYKLYPTDEQFQRVISICPMGLMLTARITTNYLQLKTMYYQRHNHKLAEWRVFCDWAAELPLFLWLIGEGESK